MIKKRKFNNHRENGTILYRERADQYCEIESASVNFITIKYTGNNNTIQRKQYDRKYYHAQIANGYWKIVN